MGLSIILNVAWIVNYCKQKYKSYLSICNGVKNAVNAQSLTQNSYESFYIANATACFGQTQYLHQFYFYVESICKFELFFKMVLNLSATNQLNSTN